MDNIPNLIRLAVSTVALFTASTLMASDNALLDLLVEKDVLTELEVTDIASITDFIDKRR